MIKKCDRQDFYTIYSIINDAVFTYHGIIANDGWHKPYMPVEELRRQIDEGVGFWKYTEAEKILGVIGIQLKEDVMLIRHLYVRTNERNKGIGSKLLRHLEGIATTPVLIDTAADAPCLIRFYQKRGYKLLQE